MTVTIVIFAAIALLLILFRIVHGDAAQISNLDELPRSTEAIDLPAFLNLIDPAEEIFLRANLTPKVFRRVQRERLLATVEYVRRAARNAGVLVQLGEAVSTEANSEVSDLGREIVTTAIKLRALALLALCCLYVRVAMPDIHLIIATIPHPLRISDRRGCTFGEIQAVGPSQPYLGRTIKRPERPRVSHIGHAGPLDQQNGAV